MQKRHEQAGDNFNHPALVFCGLGHSSRGRGGSINSSEVLMFSILKYVQTASVKMK